MNDWQSPALKREAGRPLRPMGLWLLLAGAWLLMGELVGQPFDALRYARAQATDEQAPPNGAAPLDAAPANAPAPVAAAAPDPQPAAPLGPVGQFLTIRGAIDDSVVARVTNTGLRLIERARAEQRTPVLVLQIEPGATPFHHAQGLAKQLLSQSFQPLTTVAWVPEELTGPQALVALACREIVMDPAAVIGDLGRGVSLEADEIQFAASLAERSRNPRLTPPLVRAMADPSIQLWRLLVRPTVNDPVQVRMLTGPEVEALRNSRVVIDDASLIKEQGTSLIISGQQARQWDALVSNLADSRAAVAALYKLDTEAMRERPHGQDSLARVLRLEGVIDTPQQAFLERQIDQALADGVQILIMEIDSPGGLAVASMQLASKLAEIDPQQMQTIAFIPEMALSGAALVALGCDQIYMRPLAKMGAAGPVEIAPGQIFERAPEKVVSVLRVAARGLAEKTGRPPALAEAMVDRSLIVFEVRSKTDGHTWFVLESELATNPDWERVAPLPETNGELLLTVDGNRANVLKLAERPVQDWDELRQRLGIGPRVRLQPIQPSWVDSLVFLLNRPAMGVLLFVAGIGLLYLEAHFVTGFLGIASVLCFSLFFWSKALGGTAGWLEVICFLLGVTLLLIEIFLLPGFGVFGVTGILLLVASLVMASQTFGNLEPYGDLQQAGRTLLSFALGLGMLGVTIGILSRFLPHVPLFDRMVLAPPESSSMAAATLQAMDDFRADSFVRKGDRGVAITMLRPSGKVRFGDEVIDVLTLGEFLEPGCPVEVAAVTGNTVKVRSASSS